MTRTHAAIVAGAAGALVLAVAVAGAAGGFKPAAAVVFVAVFVALTACGYALHRRAIGIRPDGPSD